MEVMFELGSEEEWTGIRQKVIEGEKMMQENPKTGMHLMCLWD